MKVITYTEALTELCDWFDALISPRSIARSNTNIIYLLFKAFAKGWEVINNVVVTLTNKFDPAKCSEEDLVSVASLVGTQKKSGSASGLHVIVTNTAEISKTLLAGTYTYTLDEDTTFEFEVLSDTVIPTSGHVDYIAMSNNIGTYEVTAQTKLTVDSIQPIDPDLVFSCTDNSNLLGVPEESNLDFRKRILTDYSRQNSLVELENDLRNLPYLFDCIVRYNQTYDDIVVGGVVVPPMTAVIFFSGEAKNDIADIVARKIICPTVATQDSVIVKYYSDVFASGYFDINIVPFTKYPYTVDIMLKINNSYINSYDAKQQIQTLLYNNFIAEVHTDFVKEEDIYNVLNEESITGVEILAINLKVNGTKVDYVEVPVSSIPELSSVHFEEV